MNIVRVYVAALIIILMVLIIAAECGAGVKGKAKSVVFMDWVEGAFMKYGTLSSYCMAQGLTGLVESAKFNGYAILSSDNPDYHVYRTAQDLAWTSAGWFTGSTIRNKDLRWFSKFRRIFGSLCYARNSYELIYRWNRTGDPFNYSEEYTSNRKAIVYIKWSSEKDWFIDAYVPGTGKYGAFIDIGFFLLGWWSFQ